MKQSYVRSFAVALIGGAWAACASQPASAPVTALTIEAKEFQFAPAARTGLLDNSNADVQT